jgi:hypothetical protein
VDDVWVTLEHIHTVPAWNGRQGYCNKTSREFCARNNISWSELINNGGLWASQLEKTGDALAIHLATWVRSLGQAEQNNNRPPLFYGSPHGDQSRRG